MKSSFFMFRVVSVLTLFLLVFNVNAMGSKVFKKRCTYSEDNCYRQLRQAIQAEDIGRGSDYWCAGGGCDTGL